MKILKQCAFDLLAIRDHGRTELYTKLVRKGYDADEVSKLCQQLEDSGLLDDFKFSCQYIRSRSVKGFGMLRIKIELQQKNILDDIIGNALDHCDVDWVALLRNVWQKKYMTMPKDIKEYVKQQRFLMQRGFAVESVYNLLKMKT